MKEIKLTLDYPPSANVYWRSDRGHVHVSQEARQYRNKVGWKCIEDNIPCFDGPIELIVHAYCPQSNSDLGNCEKVLSDALQGHCYTDDVQFQHIELFRHDAKKPKRKNAKVEVIIRPWSTP
jgi:crossover junction endodeoxyribonuclease RusA